jgi:hypothetical protein
MKTVVANKQFLISALVVYFKVNQGEYALLLV